MGCLWIGRSTGCVLVLYSFKWTDGWIHRILFEISLYVFLLNRWKERNAIFYPINKTTSPSQSHEWIHRV